MDPNSTYVPLFGVQELKQDEAAGLCTSDELKPSSSFIAENVAMSASSNTTASLKVPPPPTLHHPPAGYKLLYTKQVSAKGDQTYTLPTNMPQLPSISTLFSPTNPAYDTGNLSASGFPSYAQQHSPNMSANIASPHSNVSSSHGLSSFPPLHPSTSYPPVIAGYVPKVPRSGASAVIMQAPRLQSGGTFVRPSLSPTSTHVENRNTNGQDVNVPLRLHRYHQLGPSQVHSCDPPLPPYKVIIRQQPLRAQPPILEILKHDSNDPKHTFKPILKDDPFLIVRASLWSCDKSEEIRKSDRVPKDLSILIGNLVEPAQVLLDERETLGCFCVFADLSIRIENEFVLKFSVYDLKSPIVSITTPQKGRLVCEVFSDVFKVMSPKEFPGMSPSSALSKALRDQGVKMLVRKDKKGEGLLGSNSSTRRNSEKSEESDV